MPTDQEILTRLTAKLDIELSPYRTGDGKLRERVDYNAAGKLTHLDLSRLNLTGLPAEIVQLTNLTSLALSGNKLSSLPP